MFGKLLRYSLIFGIGVWVGVYQVDESSLPKMPTSFSIPKLPSWPKKDSTASSAKSTQESIKEKEEQQYGLYTVQVASFKTLPQAERIVNVLNHQQIDAYIAPKDMNEKKNNYRIFVGEYQTQKDAQQKLNRLKSRFKDAFVRRF